MTGAEIIALANKRGVALKIFFDKLRIRSESERDESLIGLPRDNKQAVVDAILATETGDAPSPRRSPPSCSCAA
jgi:hypothetical protein